MIFLTLANGTNLTLQNGTDLQLQISANEWTENSMKSGLNDSNPNIINSNLQYLKYKVVDIASQISSLQSSINILQNTPTGLICDFSGGVGLVPTGFLECDGSAISKVTYSNLYRCITRNLGTCTISIASPGVITLNNHGLNNGEIISFETDDRLPTGLSINTNYYVRNKATNTIQVSATLAGAIINTSGTQSGTHSIRYNPFGINETTFNLPDLRGKFIRALDKGVGIDINRIFGDYQIDENKSHTHTWTDSHISHGGNVYLCYGGGALDGTSTSGGTTSNSNITGTEFRPKNVAMLYCIKY